MKVIFSGVSELTQSGKINQRFCYFLFLISNVIHVTQSEKR